MVMVPPAVPVKTPTKAVTMEAIQKPKKSQGPISGVPRKSIVLIPPLCAYSGFFACHQPGDHAKAHHDDGADTAGDDERPYRTIGQQSIGLRGQKAAAL